jgi:hypothetical protein
MPRKDARSIVTRLVNACWSVFKVAIALVLFGGVGIGVYMYVRMDDEIRRHVEGFLQERYPELTVSVGGARLVDGKGIAVYDVSLSDPSASPEHDELFAVDELMLLCDVQLSTLVQGPPDVRRVEVKHPRLTAHRDRTGRWNLTRLIPAQPAGLKPPQIVIRSGALSISDALAANTQAVSLRDIHVNLTPIDASGALGFRIDGTLGGDSAKRIEIHATTSAPTWGGTGSIEVEQFQVADSLTAWVRAMLPPWLHSVRVSGTLDGKATLAWTSFGAPPVVQGEVTLSNGRVDDPRLPAPLTELTGRAIINGDVQQIEDLHGHCGASLVAASVNRSGWHLRAPIALSARADNVTLDEAIYRTLGTAQAEGLAVAGVLCEQWDKFSPAGVVDATIQASFDGQVWTPTASLTGRGLSFDSKKFPYRLNNGFGTIRCLPESADGPKRVEIDIVGHSRETPLHIVGQVIDPKPDAAGWVRITGENLEVDQGMIDAIAAQSPQCRDVIAQLHPAGRFNVAWGLKRETPGAPMQTGLQLDLTDIRVNYEKFPYPLRGIRGTILAQDNIWTFKDLVSGGRRTIQGSGYLQPLPKGGVELSLSFLGNEVPLDPDLYDALGPTSGAETGQNSSAPSGMQRAWTELNPRGQIDLRVDVLYRSGEAKPLSISAIVRPRESTQLRPTFFPLLMERVSGTISYRDGHVELQGMRAHNNLTTITTNGSGDFWPEGNWQFELRGLAADNVTVGAELASALRGQLGKLVDRLKPSGNFTVHNGVLLFRKGASEIAPLESEWDIEIDCHQTDLQCGIDLKYIDGSVRLKGRSDGVRSYTAGELAIESVTFQDIQFTNVAGPLWVNESRCLLGKWATDQQQLPERPLKGNVYDGSFAGRGWVKFDNLPQYQGEVKVTSADLRRIVVERFGGQQPYTGKLDANLVVDGRGYKLESLVGEGDVHIREANLYELSLLASLLKILRTGAANKTAFTESDIVFRLDGKHITLDQINFLGDVVNLYGHGQTDLDQRLNLVFRAELGRPESQLPVVRNFLAQANERIVQMYVNGTLSDPQVTTEAFPGFSQMFQQLSSDIQNPFEAADARAEQRRRLAAQQQQTK